MGLFHLQPSPHSWIRACGWEGDMLSSPDLPCGDVPELCGIGKERLFGAVWLRDTAEESVMGTFRMSVRPTLGP